MPILNLPPVVIPLATSVYRSPQYSHARSRHTPPAPVAMPMFHQEQIDRRPVAIAIFRMERLE